MPGTKGKITKSKTKNPKTVYLSDIFGLWKKGDTLFLSNQKGDQDLVQAVDPSDGPLYMVLLMLYDHGLAR